MVKKSLLFFIALFFCILFVNQKTHAESMGNSNYLLQLDTSDIANQDNQTVTITQPPAYTVQSGFEDSSSLNPFTFSISSDLIDFGILSATNPITRTSNIAVSNAPMGYQVLSSQNHQLKTSSGQFIPDTTCDNETPCTETIAGNWTSVTTFGFGYHCQNSSSCDNTSSDPNFYKHFPDSAFGETPGQILQNINNSNNIDQAAVTYKVNISGSQQLGVYSNQIMYLAVPNY